MQFNLSSKIVEKRQTLFDDTTEDGTFRNKDNNAGKT